MQKRLPDRATPQPPPNRRGDSTPDKAGNRWLFVFALTTSFLLCGHIATNPSREASADPYKESEPLRARAGKNIEAAELMKNGVIVSSKKDNEFFSDYSMTISNEDLIYFHQVDPKTGKVIDGGQAFDAFAENYKKAKSRRASLGLE